MKTLTTVVLLGSTLFLSLTAVAQVDEIKRESASHSTSSGRETRNVSSSDSGDSNSLSGEAAWFIVKLPIYIIGGIAEWQDYKIEKKKINPSVISFDVMLQGAIQPSTYYILQPRVRGNWGLFSTDFRMNYIIEESIDGTKELRTDDWQILQLNVVTTKNIIARIGGGVLHENFSGGKTFSEWTAGVHLNSNSGKVGGMVEYRWSDPRDEWNAHFQYRVFQHGAANGYVTIGAVQQEYYSKINVWGVQGGFMLRLF